MAFTGGITAMILLMICLLCNLLSGVASQGTVAEDNSPTTAPLVIPAGVFSNTPKKSAQDSKPMVDSRYDIVITEIDLELGGFKKKGFAINGKTPGDTIHMKKGGIIALDVVNNTSQVTSIHCHGIHFTDEYSWYDGAHMVTECGIPPNGGSQRYYVRPGDSQVGTYFCHSHYKGQYVDGLKFPLIIEDDAVKKTFRDAGNEYIANVFDWHKETYDKLLETFIHPHNPEGIEPTPDIPLVNGVNQYKDTLINCNGKKEVLLRVVNSSGLAQFYVFVDAHNMRVIELDGVEVIPTASEVIMIGAAQRASIIIECDGSLDASKNYAVRFLYDLNMFDSEPDGTHEARMFVTYSGNKDAEVYEDPVEVAALLEKFTGILEVQKFSPKDALPTIVGGNEKIIRLVAEFIVMDDFANHGVFNKIAFAHPVKVPSIYSMFTLDKDTYAVAEPYGSYTNTHIVEYGDVVTIILENLDAGDHPFHLHGYTFQILKDGELPSTQEEQMKDIVTDNPLRSDTVVVKSQHYAVLRFRASNPGTWMFHCHVQWHLDSGLGMNIISLPLLDGSTHPNQTFTPPSEDMLSNCLKLGIVPVGNTLGLPGLDIRSEPHSPSKLPYFLWHTSGIVGIVADALAFMVGMAVLVWHGMTR